MESAADDLEAAINSGSYDQVHRLLSEGTDPNTLLKDPETAALAFALMCGDHTIVQLLADFGAEIELLDSTGRTALSRSASAKDANGDVPLLLTLGADPNAHDSSGWTPLHFAAAAGYPTNAAALIEGGAAKDLETIHGLKAIHVARRNGHHDVAELMAE